MMCTSKKLRALALDISRRRRNKKIDGKLIVSQEDIAQNLDLTLSTVQRSEANNFLKMQLGDFINLLSLLEQNHINTDL